MRGYAAVIWSGIVLFLAGRAFGGLVTDPVPTHRAPAKPRCQGSRKIITHDHSRPGDDPMLDPQYTQYQLIDRSKQWTEQLAQCAQGIPSWEPVPIARVRFAANGQLNGISLEQNQRIATLLCAQRLAQDWSISPSTAEFTVELPIEDCVRP